jgi:3-phenylpropionate/trans-cinnamate dioxygenase ferredoxin reductase component
LRAGVNLIALMSQIHTRRPRRSGVVIVGGGLAGQRCAETLRRHGYDESIRMVCAEPHRPYDRPPLSKQILAGAASADPPAYRPADWYRRESIELLLRVAATELLPAERRLVLSDGASLRYDRLLIAPGSRPRKLPLLAGYENVRSLRTLDDCRALRQVVRGGRRLVVVGGGFIGLEVAATARGLGAEVTIIEAAPVPLAGVLGPKLGRWFTRLHDARGVRVMTDRSIERIHANGTIRALRLSTGEIVEADDVVVGVGVEPDVGWLRGTGLSTAAGIPVDPHGRTASAEILAAGDAAATFDPRLRWHVPGSHWEAAARQGARAALVMLGLEPGDAPLTSFWTDQYGIRIQYLGHARLADAVVFDGDPASANFTATFTRGGRAVGALLVDRPRELPAVRQLIEKGER